MLRKTMCSTIPSLSIDSYRTTPVKFMLILKETKSMFAFTNCNCKQRQVYSTLLVRTPLVSTHLGELIIHSLQTAYVFHRAII